MRESLSKSRKKLGLTQRQVAESIGISRSFYGLIETGVRNPRYGLAKKIARKVKKPIGRVFFDYECFKMKREN